MITFDHVSIARGGTSLFREVDLRVKKGEKVGLQGPSGSGKSSLLMAVLGAFPLTEGRISVDGTEVAPETIRTVREKIAFIGQEPVLGADHVREALLLPFSFRANRGNEPTEEQVGEVLRRVHLSENILDKRSGVVSGGEKQRLAVARALLLNKRVFLADEVTSALDEASRDAVIELLKDPAFTVLSVSHDKAWLDQCGRIFEVSDGSLLERTPAEKDNHE